MRDLKDKAAMGRLSKIQIRELRNNGTRKSEDEYSGNPTNSQIAERRMSSRLLQVSDDSNA